MYIRNTDYTGTEEMQLHCPECGFEYTHLVGFEEFKSDEGRLGITLKFDCEGGHQFDVHFRNHKGYTLLTTNSLEGGQWGTEESTILYQGPNLSEVDSETVRIFSEMKTIEPGLIEIEELVIKRNRDAANSEIYWGDVWHEIKPALNKAVGAQARNVELSNHRAWEIAGGYLQGIATNMK